MKKFYRSVFSLLIIISFLFSLAIFIAGLLIFLNIETYNRFYGSENLGVAFLIIIPEIIIFSYITIRILREMFLGVFLSKEEEKNHDSNLGSSLEKKLIIGMLAYKFLKSFVIKRNKKAYEN